MTTTRLNHLDELYLHLDRADEPWSVQLEVRVEERLDVSRVIEATRRAASHHPIARARLLPARATDVRYEWEIPDQLDHVDLEEIDCGAATELEVARERLFARTPDLSTYGPFALLLAHCADGDILALNLHHAAGDGMAAVCLMASLARAYAGEAEPEPAVDPLAVREVKPLSRASSLRQRLVRGRAALDSLGRGVTAPTRITRDRADGRPAYGFTSLALDEDELAVLTRHRVDGATINDVLLGGLLIAIDRWNERHGERIRTTYLMMPVNLRPPEWRNEVVANFASYVSMRFGRGDHASLSEAVPAAATATRRVKEGALAGLLIDAVLAPTLLPTGVKQRLQHLIPLTANNVVDTAVLSNLGRVPDLRGFGDAGAVRDVWFSPPGRMPLGVSLGAATLRGRLHLTLRYRHAQFGAGAAEDFLALYRDVLLDHDTSRAMGHQT
jgi:NRPS condensation-like uncharacterized protein